MYLVVLVYLVYLVYLVKGSLLCKVVRLRFLLIYVIDALSICILTVFLTYLYRSAKYEILDCNGTLSR